MKVTPEKRESIRRWQAANPEKVKEYQRKSLRKHWDKHLAYVRKWNKANRASRNISEGNWKARNPEKVRAVILKWREKNKERYNLITKRAGKKWAAAHPAKVKANRHNRRVRVRDAKPCDKASANVLFQLVSDAARLKCGICGKNMPKNDRTIDHVIPLSKGGTGEIWNLRIVHMSCNAKKNAKMPDELNFTP